MILPDVNVLVYAQRREFPDHERYRLWLEECLNGDEPVAFVGPVVSGFLRVVTNRRIFLTPTPLEVAAAHLETMLGAPAAVVPDLPGACIDALIEQCRAGDAAGDLVSDAYLAATATVLGAALVSADRDFARFAGLRWRRPFDR
jgi:toxin-antitoxin system PIN domain toxin